MVVKENDYLNQIRKAYYSNYGNELQSYLVKPTPKSIKKALLFLLNENRFKRTDIINLKLFLNSKGDLKKVVDRFDLDKFKTISNFLKKEEGTSGTTSLDRIEIIAWLVDYEHRPFSEFRLHRLSGHDILESDGLIKELKKDSEKEVHLYKQLRFNKKVLAQVEEDTLRDVFEEFRIESNLRFDTFRKKVKNDILIQEHLIIELQNNIATLENKLKQAHFAKRNFGSIGLFFVPIDYKDLTIEGLLNDFMDQFEGLGLGDLIDDLT